MANNVIGSLLVNLGLQTGRLKSDTEKARGHFNDFDKRASRALNNIKRQSRGLGDALTGLTGITGTLSVAGLGYLAKSSIDTADKIGKLSTRLGASTEALSEYRHVAELSGVRFETLTMGLQRMTRRVAEAAIGTGEAKGALAELNLSAQDLAQLRPEQQFETIADAINGLSSESDKVRLAMKLFDSEGVSLIQTMTNGSQGIREMRQEAVDLGLSMNKGMTTSAANANDSLTRLKAGTTALGLTMTKHLAPAITDAVNWLSINLPMATEYAANAFQALRWGILETVQFVTDKLIGFYNFLGKAPKIAGFDLGAPYRNAAKDLEIFNQSLEKTQEQLFLTKGTKQELKSDTDFSPVVVGGTDIDPKTLEKDAKEQEQYQNKLNLKLESLDLFLMSEQERLFDAYANRQFLIENAHENELISEEKKMELLLDLEAKFEKDKTKIKQKESNQRKKLEESVERSIVGMKQSTVNMAIGLMRGLGREHKDWARAAILVEKGYALAAAAQNTAVAVTKALSVDPTGMLAARVKTLGAIQMGLIGATGLLELSQVNSSGGLGSSSSGGFTGGGSVDALPVEQQQEATSNTQSSQITIQVDGNVYANDDFRAAMVEALEQAQSNDEVRILNAG